MFRKKKSYDKDYAQLLIKSNKYDRILSVVSDASEETYPETATAVKLRPELALIRQKVNEMPMPLEKMPLEKKKLVDRSRLYAEWLNTRCDKGCFVCKKCNERLQKIMEDGKNA